MPSFADSIFLFVLALLLFGPKKLPVLARELGKWVGEFRRASSEFRLQMEEELRASEQAERQKQIAAMEAAAPLPPPLDAPEHPHLPRTAATPEPDANVIAPPSMIRASAMPEAEPADAAAASAAAGSEPQSPPNETLDGLRPIPIATSGDLHMMPPATGLPTPRGRNSDADSFETDPLGGLLASVPESGVANGSTPVLTHPAPETALHGD